jgi:hypothetical protein
MMMAADDNEKSVVQEMEHKCHEFSLEGKIKTIPGTWHL